MLLGWSTGALTCYSYFQQFGCDSVSAFVNIDQSPRPLQGSASRLGHRSTAGAAAPGRRRHGPGPVGDRETVCNERSRSGQELSSIMGSPVRSRPRRPYRRAAAGRQPALRLQGTSPGTVAAQLPVLYFVSEKDSEAASRWIEANTPGAEVRTLGGHMMFWEYPDEFNREVLRFLRYPSVPHRPGERQGRTASSSRPPPLGTGHAIAHSALVLDVHRTTRVISELAAQLLDVSAHPVGVAGVRAPSTSDGSAHRRSRTAGRSGKGCAATRIPWRSGSGPVRPALRAAARSER